jgi:CBS domain-containing protein
MVDDYVLHRNIRAVPVVDAQGDVLGLVTVTDVRNVDRKDWDTTTVGQVMTPVQEMVSVSPQANAGEAVALMGQRDLNQVPVIQSGHLVGLLSQANIMRYLQVRHELGMRA